MHAVDSIVLLSGGLDSTTVLAWSVAQGHRPLALSFDYGQRHRVELESAQAIAAHYQVPHEIIRLDYGRFGGSALTDPTLEVPRFEGVQAIIPSTYVPARNTLFLSYALGLCEIHHGQRILLGISAIDYSNYPDCRPEFLEAYQTMARLATRAQVEGQPLEIIAPLIHLSKAQTIQMGTRLGAPYQHTVSCYQADAQGYACGQCDSCAFRRQGFQEAGIADPTRYQKP